MQNGIKKSKCQNDVTSQQLESLLWLSTRLYFLYCLMCLNSWLNFLKHFHLLFCNIQIKTSFSFLVLLQELLLATRSLAKCFDNVFIASQREQVVYAGFQRLQVSPIIVQFQGKQNISQVLFEIKTTNDGKICSSSFFKD